MGVRRNEDFKTGIATLRLGVTCEGCFRYAMPSGIMKKCHHVLLGIRIAEFSDMLARVFTAFQTPIPSTAYVVVLGATHAFGVLADIQSQN